MPFRYVPFDGLFNSAFKARFSAPTEFAFELCRIDRLTAIMAGSIIDQFDRCAAWSAVAWYDIVEDIADRLYDIEICAFASRPDIVGFPHVTMLQDAYQGPCMVLYVKPIAYVLTQGPFDRQRYLSPAAKSNCRS